MVIRLSRAHTRGILIWELLVAISILLIVFFPWSLILAQEQKVMRAAYYRAAAIELVDGEMEVLAAGEWKAFPAGTNIYPVKAPAAAHLPPGCFTLTMQPKLIRLEWKPDKPVHGGPVVREVMLP